MTPASKDVPCFLKLKTPVARGRRARKEGLGGNLPLFMGIVNSSTRKISLEMDTQYCVTSQTFNPPQMKGGFNTKQISKETIFKVAVYEVFLAIYYLGGCGMSWAWCK